MCKREKVHFEDFPKTIYINLDIEFRKKFFSDFCNKFNSDKEAALYLFEKAKKYSRNDFNSLYSQIRQYKTFNTEKFIPIWLILEVAKINKYNLKVIEKNIGSYNSQRGVVIKDPILPIKVTPEFDSILAHMLGDGTDKRNKSNTGDYCQYNKISLYNFIDKIKKVFGTIELKVNDKKVNVSSCIILILKKYFNISDFGTFASYLPKKLFTHSKYHKLAVILSFIVDEGTVYDNVSIRMANKKIINDIRRLIISCGYSCRQIRKTPNISGTTCYKVSLLNSDLKCISNDIKKLSHLFPTCTLVHRQESFNFLANYSRSCARKRYYGETKRLILELLNNKKYKTYELAKILNISRRTTSIHLDELEKQNKVYLYKVTNMGAKIWSSD